MATKYKVTDGTFSEFLDRSTKRCARMIPKLRTQVLVLFQEIQQSTTIRKHELQLRTQYELLRLLHLEVENNKGNILFGDLIAYLKQETKNIEPRKDNDDLLTRLAIETVLNINLIGQNYQVGYGKEELAALKKIAFNAMDIPGKGPGQDLLKCDDILIKEYIAVRKKKFDNYLEQCKKSNKRTKAARAARVVKQRVGDHKLRSKLQTAQLNDGAEGMIMVLAEEVVSMKKSNTVENQQLYELVLQQQKTLAEVLRQFKVMEEKLNRYNDLLAELDMQDEL